jgi:integrase/recombinase XerD
LKAFVLLMRYSGLRIIDAACLAKDRLQGNKLFLFTAKTGTPVYVPLPDFAVELLNEVGEEGPFFFWSGTSKPEGRAGDFHRSLRILFKDAGVKGSSHSFRNTFSVELLLAGVPIEQVAMLLGHRDPKVTWKHYAAFVQSRRIALEEAVKKSWG